MKLKKNHLILLSVASGLLLALAWPERGFPGLLFIGLVPLFFLEEYLHQNRDRIVKFSALLFSYPGFFTWNILTTWWIVNSTLIGAILAIVLNSLFMSIIFQAFHWTRKYLKERNASYVSLVCYWIAFEYLHLNWDLNWPWLNLGNGFSSYYQWVQWYEYTGAMGGTVWVLVGNMLFYELLCKVISHKSKVKTETQNSKTDSGQITVLGFFQNSKSVVRFSSVLFGWIFIPILISCIIYCTYREEKHPVNFVVAQPNLDPYSEQYSLAPEEVIGRIMKLTWSKLNDSVDFLIAPESAIQEDMWENDLRTFHSIRLLRQITDTFPDLNILVGGSTLYAFRPGESIPRTARKFSDTGGAYNAYNTAILLNNRDSLQLYHKSKLTPGVEILPSFKGFKWLENFAIDLGGTVGSLGMDSIRKVYTTINTVPVGPAICYESIFGEFFATFAKNGAQIMIIITNDGWWGNTAGHRQHFAFAHLRAIETRRSIARSANTGISALIDQRGDAHQVTPYWKPAVIKGNLNANEKLTFYVKHGDYIARVATVLTLLILGWCLILAILRKTVMRVNVKQKNSDEI